MLFANCDVFEQGDEVLTITHLVGKPLTREKLLGLSNNEQDELRKANQSHRRCGPGPYEVWIRGNSAEDGTPLEMKLSYSSCYQEPLAQRAAHAVMGLVRFIQNQTALDERPARIIFPFKGFEESIMRRLQSIALSATNNGVPLQAVGEIYRFLAFDVESMRFEIRNSRGALVHKSS